MLVVLAGWQAPVDGAAADMPTQVTWRAPAGCPDASVVRSRIAQLGGASSSGAVQVDAEVLAIDGGFSLRLRVSSTSIVDERELVAERCEALADTTALVAALAADPIATATVVDVPRIVEATRTGPGEAAIGDPTGDPTGGAAPTSVTPPSRPRDRPREVVRDDPGPREREPRSIGVWTRLRAGVQYGAVPGATFGLDGAIAIGGRRVRGELAGSWWVPRTASAVGESIRVQLGVVSPRICGTLPQGRIDVVLCGGPEIGIMRGDVRGGPTRLPLWLALTAEAGVRVPVSPRVSVWTSVAAAAPLRFPRFRLVDASGTRQREVYRPAAAGVRGLVGIEVRLRGRDR